VCALKHAIDRVMQFNAIKQAMHVNVLRLSSSSAPSPVSLQPPSPIAADSDATDRWDKSIRDDDVRYDPVIEVNKLEKILGLSWHDHENCDDKARYGIV
jgi:hypothetical protein